MAILVVFSLVVLIFQEFGKKTFKIPENRFISSLAGALSGLSSPYFLWHTFSVKTIVLGVMMLPVIYIGSKLGVKLIEKINETTYRKLMFIITVLGALNLIV